MNFGHKFAQQSIYTPDYNLWNAFLWIICFQWKSFKRCQNYTD